MGTSTQNVVQTTTNLPSYAEPSFQIGMQKAGGLLDEPYQRRPADLNRVAGFTPGQQYAMNQQMNAKGPGEYDTGSALATAAGLGSLEAGKYNPGQFNYQTVQGGNYNSPLMGAAQSDYDPNIQTYGMNAAQSNYKPNLTNYQMQAQQTDYNPQIKDYQMQGPGQFGAAERDQYMSPYQQGVTDIAKREATRDAKMTQLSQDLGAARQGAYGGSRALLAGLNRERNLGQNLSDIQTKGLQSAYENAQQQYERDRAAGIDVGKTNLASLQQAQQLRTDTGLKTSLANLDARQQAQVQNLAANLQTQGLSADQALKVAMMNTENQQRASEQNLASQNTAQGLRADIGSKMALANLDARQQANVQNLAAQLQTQGLNADQALKAALANQQAGMDTQKATEQSRQFASTQGLAGLNQAGQMAQTLSNIGLNRANTDQTLRDKAMQTATYEQDLNQRKADIDEQDWREERDYRSNRLQEFNSMLRGFPIEMNKTVTTTGQNPTTAQQILGGGLGAVGAYKALQG